MKQTAVEWLVDKLEIFATEEEMNIIQQAKEMEKEQIIEACMYEFADDYDSAEEYYEETFKSE